MENVQLRRYLKVADYESVRDICDSTGFFYPEEVDVAVELLDERIQRGEDCGYYFVFAELDGKTIGYSCFGPVPMTKGSWDLYWIVTHNDYRGKGIGKMLLQATYDDARKLGARAIYAETSGREKYVPTRKFYENNQYSIEVVMKDFYDLGDDKYVYKFKL